MTTFRFLKYIKPIWYFNLAPQMDHGYFPAKEDVKVAVLFEEDFGYESVDACKLDWAWNAFQSGLISDKPFKGLNFQSNSKFSVSDEYRFIRKNFSSFWSLYILILRLLSLHYPIEEIRGYSRSRSVRRVLHHQHPISYPEFNTFKSELLAANPLVSIIIPTLDRYQYLKDVLFDLEKQTYKNIEIIVVDQSEPYNSKFYEGWSVPVSHWYQKEKALWKARNEAILKCRGDLILLFDDDSRVESDWVIQHIRVMDFFKADISSGVSLSSIGDQIPSHYSYFRWSDQLDTGNVLIKRLVFEKIGLFDRQFEKQRMGDGEFGLRAYLAGFRNVSNPLAKRIHLKVAVGGLRQMGYWDGWRPKNIFSPRPIPSVLYYYRKYFGNKAALFSILSTVVPSLIPYRFKNKKRLTLMALFFFPFIIPVVLIQVIVSWYKASDKLGEGALISYLPSKTIDPLMDG